MDTIRWGIISTGNIAHSFATGLQAVPSAELVAVGSRSQASADQFAAEFDVPHAYDSYEALANDPNVDVVYIGTPHVFHAENMLMCLNAGKHVLCEKPLTINAREAMECIALANEKNLFLMEAVWMRFIPAIIEIEKIIDKGIIGDITLIQADFSFHIPFQPDHRLFNPELGGGALLDVGIYPISFTTLLLGLPQSVTSHAIIGDSGVDEQCAMMFKYDNAVALLSAGISGDLTNDAVIKGTKGRIIVDAPFFVPQKITVQVYGQDEDSRDIPYDGNGYNYEIEAVHEALRAGQIEHGRISHQHTLSVMQLMDDMRQEWELRYPQEE